MKRNIKEVLRWCKRDNLDKKRLATFHPRALPEIHELPIYSLEEVDILNKMIYSECEDDPASQVWFKNFKGVHSCYKLFVLFDTVPIGVDIVELLLKPFDEVPLMINVIEPRLHLFLRWRLKIGK